MNVSGRSTVESDGSHPRGAGGFDASGLSGGMLAGVWVALVAVGIAGRVWQPTYNVTPLVGLALVAGALFPSRLVAASVPAAALALSNLALPGGGAYGSWVMAAVIYAAFMWPVLAGPLVRRHRMAAAIGGSLAGSLVFYLSTNFVHWCFGSDYPHTLAGLGECYVAALPFYRWMPVGDLVWTAALVLAASRLVALTGRHTAAEAA